MTEFRLSHCVTLIRHKLHCNWSAEHTAPTFTQIATYVRTFPDKDLTVRTTIPSLTKAAIVAEVASIQTGTSYNDTSRAQATSSAHCGHAHRHRAACSSSSGGMQQLTQILSVVHFTERATETLWTVAARIVAVEASILTEAHISP